MFDQFGRKITYLRLSVTDRCNLRCFYCTAEKMAFVPQYELLSLEELDKLCGVFIQLGIRKIRLTGGEPLVRGGVMALVRSLSRYLVSGVLDELTLTTNGTRLARYAHELAAAGVQRLNVSLDTLKPDRFQRITRHGSLAQVLDGIATAAQAGLRVRINTVALANLNEDELTDLVIWSGDHNYNICFIEAMPLGNVDGSGMMHYLPLSKVRAKLEQHFTLMESGNRTGGPARYVHCAETNQQIGFITPMTYAFCASCNRVRLTCSGTLLLCLGHEEAVDLRMVLRRTSKCSTSLTSTIIKALRHKPRSHNFITNHNNSTYSCQKFTRHMNVIGG